MVWTKGPRCGIDNCGSRFYRVINGRRVCQNNHIQEGLETTGDDDDYQAVGQRIRQPGNRKSRNTLNQRAYQLTTLRGIEAKRLVWEFMQTVFQHQMKYVMAKCHLPDEFEVNCRELWACFLNLYRSERFTLSHIVCLLYLATRRSNDQLLLADFNLWIRLSKFPYLETYRLLPPDRFKLLPPDLRKHFMPSSGPGRLKLHEQTVEIKRRLSKHFRHLKFHDIDPRYVCFRMCRDLLLSPVIYDGALKLLDLLERGYDPSRVQAGLMYEEIPALCAVVVSAKLYHGFGDSRNHLPSPDTRLDVDWGVWDDIVKKIWILHPDIGCADESLAHNWSGEQVDDYLAWYSKHLTTPSLDKRVKAIFPVPDIPGDVEDSYPTSEVLSELCEVLYSTFSDSALPSHSHKAENVPGQTPGKFYKVYSIHSEKIPSSVLILYEILERFLNTDAETVRTIVRGFELRIRRQFTPPAKSPGVRPVTVVGASHTA